MKPYHKMKIEEKARLLYLLFPEQVKSSITYIADEVRQFQEAPEDKDRLLSSLYWKQLAKEIQYRCEHNKRIYKSSRVFAAQLFEGFYALITNAILKEYIKQPEIAGTAFAKAAEILLTINPIP